MIIWDEQKNQKLIRERNVSFEEVADKILLSRYFHKYYDVLGIVL